MLSTFSVAALLAVGMAAPGMPVTADPVPTEFVTVPVTVPAWKDGGYLYLPDTGCPGETAPYLLDASFKDPEYRDSSLTNGVSFSYEVPAGGCIWK